MRKLILQIFPRNRYKASTSGNGVPHLPPEREKIARLLGSANRVNVHVRIYDMGSGATLNFNAFEGSFSNEMPMEGNAMLTLAPVMMGSAALPWDATNIPPPGDGWFYLLPHFGVLDLLATTGGANSFVEFEAWATLEFWPQS